MQRRRPFQPEQNLPDPLEVVADVALAELFSTRRVLITIEGIKKFMPYIQEAPGTKKWLSYKKQNLFLPPNQAKFIQYLRDKLNKETKIETREIVADFKIMLDSYWPKYSDNYDDETGVMTCPISFESLPPPPTALAITLESGRRFNSLALINTQQPNRPRGFEPFEEAKYNFSKRDWVTLKQAARDPSVRRHLKQEDLAFFYLRSSWIESIWDRQSVRYLFHVLVCLSIMAALMFGLGNLFSAPASFECMLWGTIVGGVGVGILSAYSTEFFGVNGTGPFDPPRKEVQIGQDHIGWLELWWDSGRLRDNLRICYESKMRERNAFSSTGYRVARQLDFRPEPVPRSAGPRKRNQATASTDESKHARQPRFMPQARGHHVSDSESEAAQYASYRR